MMSIANDYPVNCEGVLNDACEMFERTQEVHPTMEGLDENQRDGDLDWDCFPGLLPA